ncbi:Alpha/beta hydrolase fold-1 domain-containing protein [Penicillium ucsense]|uniref:Alpha/beta hydrolase fold-1 domain-containing protein n=1 Tax=Penicillium ucsense TaxID=2839758 RepID=A0A8J8W001_9EURO|nr:Alpha/beta hydrolase fold-1 domain-containing protein [Penicillium ucsense]KAF7734611.1 Alpha/beta hydrolase fold-1 domain-containing protein [Penicillium ucsense]
MRIFSAFSAVSAISSYASFALAQPSPDPVGTIYDGDVPANLYGSDYPYPWPVKLYNFYNQRQNLTMAFMDVPAPCENDKDKVAVLLHGGNFCGVTWSDTARQLTAAGYRVILPDDIGFCKSSKPQGYSYNVHQQAENIKSLLNVLGIEKATVMGHSMGGMIATRFGLMYPDNVDQLFLVDPLGLEDWVAKGVPYVPVDATYQGQLTQNFTTLKAYEQASYFHGAEWKPEYDKWVQMLANIYAGDYGSDYAYVMGLVTDALLSQPIFYHLPLLKTRTYLMVGDADVTALGKQQSPPEVVAKLGHYAELGPAAAAMIPNCTFHMFAGLGHAPFLQDPEAFYKVLLSWLD